MMGKRSIDHDQIDNLKRGFDCPGYIVAKWGGTLQKINFGYRIAGISAGGLEINTRNCIWSIQAPEIPCPQLQGKNGIGGDYLDLVGYVIFGAAWSRRDPEQLTVVCQEMAAYSGGSYAGSTSDRSSTTPQRSTERKSRKTGVDAAGKITAIDSTRKNAGKLGKIVAEYSYLDAAGTLAHQTIRFEPKDFRQRRPDGAGGWVWNLDAIELFPYNFPAVVEAITRRETIYLVEGEKDADNLITLGLVATCFPMGAGKSPEWLQPIAGKLQGARLVLLPDNDAPGEQYMTAIAEMMQGVAASIRIVRLPGLPAKGDVSDFIGSNTEGAAEAIVEIAAETTPLPSMAELCGVFVPSWDNEPAYTPPAITLGGVRIGSTGNHCIIISPPGTGKSAVLEAAAARSINPNADAFGFDLVAPRGVLYIDTERSKEDHHRSWRRMCRRAGFSQGDALPAGILFALFATVAKIEDRRRLLEAYVRDRRPSIVMIDGIADFVSDPNDLVEAQACVSWLTALANTYDFATLITVHPNPTPGNDKARGHIGSEVQRRAEGVLFLKKESGGQRTITTNFQHGKVRNAADLAESYFRWNDEVEMFTSCTNEVDSTPRNLDRLVEYADEVFRFQSSRSYSDLLRCLQLVVGAITAKECSQDNAKRIYRQLRDANLIVQGPDKKWWKNGNEIQPEAAVGEVVDF